MGKSEKSESLVHQPEDFRRHGKKNGGGKNSQLASIRAHRVRVGVLDVEALEIPVDCDVSVRIQGVIGT
jgi:hypothetical protein